MGISGVAVKWNEMKGFISNHDNLVGSGAYSNTHSFFLFHFLILFCLAFWCTFLCYLYGMFSNLSVLDTSFKMIADDCSKNHDNFRAYIWGWVNKRKRKKPGGSSLQLFCFLFSYKLFGLLLDFSESSPWLLWLESRNCNKPGSTIGQQKN